MGNDDGEEDNAEPSMDEGRAAHAEDARGPGDKDNGDRAWLGSLAWVLRRGCRCGRSRSLKR
jgi:hypothetical protein